MTNSQSNLNSEQHIADILPLVEIPERKVPSSEGTTFKLNTSPAEATSPKMDFNVNHLTGTETTREVITFVARVRELKLGLGITDIYKPCFEKEEVVTYTQLQLNFSFNNYIFKILSLSLSSVAAILS